jgi:hypothetical protein
METVTMLRARLVAERRRQSLIGIGSLCLLAIEYKMAPPVITSFLFAVTLLAFADFACVSRLIRVLDVCHGSELQKKA